MPTDSQFDAVLKLIEQAEQSLANSKLLLDNSVRNVDTSLISLTEAVNSYCDFYTLPNRGDVCVELYNYPINK